MQRILSFSPIFFSALYQDKLAANITTEQGKTLKDAQGDVFRGLGMYQFLFLLFHRIGVPCIFSFSFFLSFFFFLVLFIYLFFIVIVEVVEHACGMATLQMGEFVSNVSHGIDTYSIREPLGVCAGICPFNFPAMIPLWVRTTLFS